MDTRIHLQIQKCSACRTPAEGGQGHLTSRKDVENHAKPHRMKELGGKTGVLLGMDLPSVGGRTEARVQSPHRSSCLSQRRNI